MPLFRKRFRVKARQSRGEAQEYLGPTEALQDMLVNNYDETKTDYEAMGAELKESFMVALGEKIGEAFPQGGTVVDMELIAMDVSDHEAIYNSITNW